MDRLMQRNYTEVFLDTLDDPQGQQQERLVRTISSSTDESNTIHHTSQSRALSGIACGGAMIEPISHGQNKHHNFRLHDIASTNTREGSSSSLFYGKRTSDLTHTNTDEGDDSRTPSMATLSREETEEAGGAAGVTSVSTQRAIFSSLSASTAEPSLSTVVQPSTMPLPFAAVVRGVGVTGTREEATTNNVTAIATSSGSYAQSARDAGSSDSPSSSAANNNNNNNITNSDAPTTISIPTNTNTTTAPPPPPVASVVTFDKPPMTPQRGPMRDRRDRRPPSLFSVSASTTPSSLRPMAQPPSSSLNNNNNSNIIGGGTWVNSPAMPPGGGGVEGAPSSGTPTPLLGRISSGSLNMMNNVVTSAMCVPNSGLHSAKGHGATPHTPLESLSLPPPSTTLPANGGLSGGAAGSATSILNSNASFSQSAAAAAGMMNSSTVTGNAANDPSLTSAHLIIDNNQTQIARHIQSSSLPGSTTSHDPARTMTPLLAYNSTSNNNNSHNNANSVAALSAQLVLQQQLAMAGLANSFTPSLGPARMAATGQHNVPAMALQQQYYYNLLQSPPHGGASSSGGSAGGGGVNGPSPSPSLSSVRFSTSTPTQNNTQHNSALRLINAQQGIAYNNSINANYNYGNNSNNSPPNASAIAADASEASDGGAANYTTLHLSRDGKELIVGPYIVTKNGCKTMRSHLLMNPIDAMTMTPRLIPKATPQLRSTRMEDPISPLIYSNDEFPHDSVTVVGEDEEGEEAEVKRVYDGKKEGKKSKATAVAIMSGRAVAIPLNDILRRCAGTISSSALSSTEKSNTSNSTLHTNNENNKITNTNKGNEDHHHHHHHSDEGESGGLSHGDTPQRDALAETLATGVQRPSPLTHPSSHRHLLHQQGEVAVHVDGGHYRCGRSLDYGEKDLGTVPMTEVGDNTNSTSEGKGGDEAGRRRLLSAIGACPTSSCAVASTSTNDKCITSAAAVAECSNGNNVGVLSTTSTTPISPVSLSDLPQLPPSNYVEEAAAGKNRNNHTNNNTTEADGEGGGGNNMLAPLPSSRGIDDDLSSSSSLDEGSPLDKPTTTNNITTVGENSKATSSLHLSPTAISVGSNNTTTAANRVYIDAYNGTNSQIDVTKTKPAASTAGTVGERGLTVLCGGNNSVSATPNGAAAIVGGGDVITAASPSASATVTAQSMGSTPLTPFSAFKNLVSAGGTHSWQLRISDLEILGPIDSGASATVYKAKHRETLKAFAIKRIDLSELIEALEADRKRQEEEEEDGEGDEWGRMNSFGGRNTTGGSGILSRLSPKLRQLHHIVFRELKMLHSQYRSAHVLKIYDAFFDSDEHTLDIAMEYMHWGSLVHLGHLMNPHNKVLASSASTSAGQGGGAASQPPSKKARAPLPERLLAVIAEQVLHGLKDMHAKGHVHRDIKPGNVLVNSNGVVKLSDFGLVETVTNIARSEGDMGDDAIAFCSGTDRYMSPERQRGESHGPPSDIWALGMSLAECAIGRYPVDVSRARDAFERIDLMSKVRYPPSIDLSNDFKNFVELCMRPNPATRPTAEQLLDHPFLSRWEGEYNLAEKLDTAVKRQETYEEEVRRNRQEQERIRAEQEEWADRYCSAYVDGGNFGGGGSGRKRYGKKMTPTSLSNSADAEGRFRRVQSIGDGNKKPSTHGSPTSAQSTTATSTTTSSTAANTPTVKKARSSTLTGGSKHSYSNKTKKVAQPLEDSVAPQVSEAAPNVSSSSVSKTGSTMSARSKTKDKKGKASAAATNGPTKHRLCVCKHKNVNKNSNDHYDATATNADAEEEATRLNCGADHSVSSSMCLSTASASKSWSQQQQHNTSTVGEQELITTAEPSSRDGNKSGVGEKRDKNDDADNDEGGGLMVVSPPSCTSHAGSPTSSRIAAAAAAVAPATTADSTFCEKFCNSCGGELPLDGAASEGEQAQKHSVCRVTSSSSRSSVSLTSPVTGSVQRQHQQADHLHSLRSKKKQRDLRRRDEIRSKWAEGSGDEEI